MQRRGRSGAPDIVGFGSRRVKISPHETKAICTLGTSMSYQDYSGATSSWRPTAA